MADIKYAITIDAALDRVSPLVSTAEGLAAWWAEDVAGLPGSAAVELGFFSRATVYKLTPQPEPQGARWMCETGREWAGTDIVFRLHPNGAQTLVEFSREHWAEATPYCVSCNTVWGHLMFKLKDAAERGGSPRPLFTRTGMESSTSRAY